MPVPYQGEKGFIFISYAHRDSELVWPIVERMQRDGCRIWYDEGIDPGTEWDQNIAGHVERCGYFIAFLSRGYLASENCKDELNYARDLNKPRLLVYLEDVRLPGGMAMRLNRLQAVFWCRYADKEAFYAKLYKSQGLDALRDAPGQTLPEPEQRIPSEPEFQPKPEPVPEEAACTQSESEPVPETELGSAREEALPTPGEEPGMNPESESLSAPGTDQKPKPAAPESDFELDGLSLVRYHGADSVVAVPERVTYIGNLAFSGCEALTCVFLPKRLRKIGGSIFENCPNLVAVYLPEHVPKPVLDRLVRDGYGDLLVDPDTKEQLVPPEFEIAGAVLLCYNGSASEVVIPKGVTEIGECAFEFDALTDVVLPEGVTRIGAMAFLSCEELKRVVIPSTVTEIGLYCFAGCDRLERIVIPYAAPARAQLVEKGYEGILVDPDEEKRAAKEAAERERRERKEADKRDWLARGDCPECGVKLSLFRKCPRCGKRWK